MNIIQVFNDYISEHGIKQGYIAQKTGIPQNIVSRILSGKRRITADEFIKICGVLNIDPNLFRKQEAS